MGSNFLLTIGALVLLGIFTLAANSLMSENIRLAEENEYYLTALSLAESVIQEAKTKSFDQNTSALPVTSQAQLTNPTFLGPELSEAFALPDSGSGGLFRSTTAYNDVDDYNDYQRIVWTPRAEGYDISVSVRYASPSWPDSVVNYPTYCKQMTVTVTSPYISQPVILQYAFIY